MYTRACGQVGLEGVDVHPEGARLSLRGGVIDGANPSHAITTRLVLDCMGHNSPIVKQLR